MTTITRTAIRIPDQTDIQLPPRQSRGSPARCDGNVNLWSASQNGGGRIASEHDLRDYQRLRISVGDGICRTTLDSPPINLLDIDLIGELARFVQQVGDDDTVRVVIVDSADPDFFLAHADVTLIQRLPTEAEENGAAFGRC